MPEAEAEAPPEAAAAAAAIPTLPDGSPMPMPWKRILDASAEGYVRLGPDGALLHHDTELCTYGGLLDVTVEKETVGCKEYFYQQSVCRAPLASGGRCELVQKLTRNGETNIEPTNTMTHFVAKHSFIVNLAHLKKKGKETAKDEPPPAVIFSRAAIEEEQKKLVMLSD